MEQRLGPCHDLINRLFLVTYLGCFMGLSRVAQRNPRLFGKHPQCFPETDSFTLLDKAEYISSDVADPAFPGLAIGIDLQTWVRVVMPWADGRKASPLAT